MLHVFALAAVLAAAQPNAEQEASAPCAACVAVIVESDSLDTLPPSLSGLDVLVPLRGGAPANALALLQAIRDRGGRAGGILEAPGGDLLPELASHLDVVVVPVDSSHPSVDAVAFDVKTRLTRLRARLGAAKIGLRGPEDVLKELLSRDVAAYLDFVVSAQRIDAPLPWWRIAGDLTDLVAAVESSGGSAERTLWRGAEEGELARTLGDLAHAAAFFPPGLIAGDREPIKCGGLQGTAWFNPATIEYVAWLSRCETSELQAGTSGTRMHKLSSGDLLVALAKQDQFSDEVDVRGSRVLTIQEIVARHQAAAARQALTIRSRISSGTMTLTFEAPGFPAPVTISADTVVYADGSTTEVEHRAIRINGLAFGRDVPRLPLLEPERVASPPLAIELTNVYRYSLEGQDELGGTHCYVVRFEPAAAARTLFKGRAWISADRFALVKVSATQTALKGPIVSSEQTDEFAQTSDGLWLLRRSRVNQVYEGAAHRTPIERVVVVGHDEINAPDFDERRRAAHASSHVMLRDTPAGYRYLVPAKQGDPESASSADRRIDRPANRVRTVVLGAILDPNISHPLPFAGLSYVNFDLFGTGTQFNGFFGGTFGQLAFSIPTVGGTRWQLAGRAFGIATSFNDRAFEAGRERYEQNIRQRPAHASVWLTRPLTPRVAFRAGYDLDYTRFDRAETTDPSFVVPQSQLVHAFRLTVDVQRAGWNASAWWSPAVRTGWREWGTTDAPDYDPRHSRFQRYGLSLARSAVLTPDLVVRGELSWMSGRDLDRFSRYAFGAFDNRLRGYPAALIRYDRGGVARGAMAWSPARRFRVDGFLDTALVHDPGFGRGIQRFTGIGAAVETPAPFGTLLAAEWGFGVEGVRADGRRGTHVVRVSAYKVF